MKDMWKGCLLLVIVALVGIGLLSTCTGGGRKASVDTEALKTRVVAAEKLTPEVIDETRVDGSGGVTLTLKLTKEALGGAGGINQARKVTSGIAGEILTKVPEATSVGVFDANNKMIDVYRRK